MHAENQLKSLKSHLAERIVAINRNQSRKKNHHERNKNGKMQWRPCNVQIQRWQSKQHTHTRARMWKTKLVCTFSACLCCGKPQRSLSSNAMQRASTKSHNFTARDLVASQLFFPRLTIHTHTHAYGHGRGKKMNFECGTWWLNKSFG